MKKIIVLGFLIFPVCLFSQSYNYLIDDMLNEISLDSLIKHVRILSGEDSVMIDGSNYLIQTRVNNLSDHELTGHYKAMQYLVNELRKYTPNVTTQEFPFRDDTVRNIISWINGADTSRKIILSGHYDSRVYSQYDPLYAPGANDNGSGVAAVLETIRILSQYDLQNSVYFILWDMEEDGCLGSEYYAEKVKESTDYMAMINLDEIAYDTLSKSSLIFSVNSVQVVYQQKLEGA